MGEKEREKNAGARCAKLGAWLMTGKAYYGERGRGLKNTYYYYSTNVTVFGFQAVLVEVIMGSPREMVLKVR